MVKFVGKNSHKAKVTKSQICDGMYYIKSENTCHEGYYLCGKFHAFMKKHMIWLILGATPLYYRYKYTLSLLEY